MRSYKVIFLGWRIFVGMILKYADTLYDRIPAGKDAELIRHNIDFLKAEIAKFQ